MTEATAMIEQLKGFGSPENMETLTGLGILLGVALVLYLITHFVVLRVVRYVVAKTEWTWDDDLEREGAFRRLARAVPFLVVQPGLVLVPNLSPEVAHLVTNLAMAAALFFVMRAAAAFITAVQKRPAKPGVRQAPIRGYLELLRIAIYIIGTIVIVGMIIDRSPMLLLSGLGAASAVLMLVFKDTILGFVASVQISSNDMLRIGDWIEMPSAGADGDVIEIGIHTVKVVNWDKTVTTIPTWKLITESFKNWRAMFETGGRRIKRSIFIDASSVRFLADEEFHNLRSFRILDEYLLRKEQEIQQWNESLGDPGRVPHNQRRLTNLGTFRAYAQAYLAAHPEIHKGMTNMVRQLATGSEGIPLELYAFTNNTAWKEYERIQADIFDHLYSIIGEFGLNIYQQPGGSDLRQAGNSLEQILANHTTQQDNKR